MKYLSRKFLLAVGIIVLIVLNKKLNLGLDLDESVIKTILIVALGYIGVEGVKDVVTEIKKK